MSTPIAAALAERLATPLPESVIATLPAGPSPDARAAQRFTYTLDAVATDGRQQRAVIEGRDTYGTTAVIAVTCALRLVAGGRPGARTPAQAFPAAELLADLPVDVT
ncbi:hypothetical protein [Dactylosporangium sp. CS-033363]|uniref:hypothetical protein n=1 Tax=Dactylosporangium sp. CS-033363 TaxID=3239935 RepID=UPI003D8AB0EB